jgi:hypothetical protein
MFFNILAVHGERIHGRVAGCCRDLSGNGPGPGDVAAGDADPGAHRGQAGGGGLADPARAAGDQNRLAGHRAGADASHR